MAAICLAYGLSFEQYRRLTVAEERAMAQVLREVRDGR